jgi:hypothetical protein
MQLSLISGWGTLGYMMQSVGERFSLPQNVKENLMKGMWSIRSLRAKALLQESAGSSFSLSAETLPMCNMM